MLGSPKQAQGLFTDLEQAKRDADRCIADWIAAGDFSTEALADAIDRTVVKS